MASQAKPIAAIRAALFGILVFAPLLVVNAMQMISILWRYVSPKLFRRYNSFWADNYWSYCVWLAKNLGGFVVEITGDKLPEGESAVVLSNHQSAVDIVVQLAFGRVYDRLGDMKFFAKDVLKYIPGPGWGMVFLDCIFMKRDWTRDRANVVHQLQKFKKDGAPIWINLYPEGTRLKPSKLKSAQEFAAKNNLPIPKNLLIPRIKGFLATVEGLEGHIGAVYDLTIAYPNGKPPTLWGLLSAEGQRVKVEVKRYPIQTIPQNQEALGQWLMELYRSKELQLDRMMASFK